MDHDIFWKNWKWSHATAEGVELKRGKNPPFTPQEIRQMESEVSKAQRSSQPHELDLSSRRLAHAKFMVGVYERHPEIHELPPFTAEG